MSEIYKSDAGAAAVRERYATFLQHWPAPSEQLRLATRHGETFVVACGAEDALPLVLLHGSGINSAMWMGDVPAWTEHFRIFAVDLIGEPGFSAPERPPLGSGAYVEWLEDVLDGLGLASASLVGISLGGWMALELATHCPDRIDKLVLLCPGGVGRHRNVLIWALPLLMLGRWGRARFLRRIGGRPGGASAPPSARAFGDFMSLIFTHFRPRRERLPQFSDAALQRLTMPVLAVLGGQDAFIDSAGTRRRLEQNLPRLDTRFLPDAGHFLPDQSGPILQFLTEPHAQAAPKILPGTGRGTASSAVEGDLRANQARL